MVADIVASVPELQVWLAFTVDLQPNSRIMDELVMSFMENDAPHLHSAFAEKAVYDTQRSIYRKREPIDELRDSLRYYQQHRLGPELKFDPNNCTWAEIVDMIAKARKEYEKKAAGLKGLMIKGWRGLGDNSSRIEPLLDLIPEDMGLSALRGGLGWILIMAKESARKRDAVFATFEEIPEAFILAARKRKLYPNNTELREQLAIFHAVTVSAIVRLITFLLPKARVNALFPCIKDTPSDRDFDMILSELHGRIRQFREFVDNMIDTTIVDTHQMMQTVSQDVHRLEYLYEDLRNGQQAASLDFQAMVEQSGIAARNTLLPVLQDMFKSWQRHCELLTQRIRQDQFLGMEQMYHALPPMRLPSKATAMMTAEQLFRALQVTPVNTTRDLQTVLRAGQQLDWMAQTRATEMMQGKRFDDWCYSTHRDILLVEDLSMRDNHWPRISPLSTVCASIIAGIITAQPDAVPLFSFCGLQTVPPQGPRVVARTLLSRVLMEIHQRSLVNLDFISNRPYRERLESHDMATLCDTLKHLMAQLPLDTAVYCVLDGIGFLEQSEWSEDLIHLINTLHEMVCDDQLRPLLKVLVTNPMRCLMVSRYFRANDIVRLGVESRPTRGNFAPERYMMLKMIKAKASEEGQAGPGTGDVDENDDEDDEYCFGTKTTSNFGAGL